MALPMVTSEAFKAAMSNWGHMKTHGENPFLKTLDAMSNENPMLIFVMNQFFKGVPPTDFLTGMAFTYSLLKIQEELDEIKAMVE